MKSQDRLYHLPGEFDLYRCAACGLILIYPFLENSRLGSYYPEDYYSYSDSKKIGEKLPASGPLSRLFKHPLKNLNGLLYSKIQRQNQDETVPVGSAVLDVGCGDGRYLLKKKEEGAVCFGVDISEGAISKLKSRNPEMTVFCGDLWVAHFPEASFRLINLCHVLEHVQPTGTLLAEIKRLLMPGGRLRVQVPNGASLTRLMFGPYWMALDTPRHVYIFSKKNLRRLFEQQDLRVVSVRTLENSFSVLGSLVYVCNAVFGKKMELMKLEKFWDNEFLKLLLFPYSFFVNLFGVGDSIEFILEKKHEA